MTTDLDLPELSDPLLEAAEKLRTASDFKLPELEYWNTDPCPHHDEPTPSCEYRQCGGNLWSHQRVGVGWLYLRKNGLLADGTGFGKTNQVYGLLALLKQRGELTGRCLVVCQTPAVAQWVKEGHRWVPRMHVEGVLSGWNKQQRMGHYMQNWDVLISGYHVFNTDFKIHESMQPDVLVIDDVDPLLNHDNVTARNLNHLARTSSRVIVINATAIQVRLQQIHAATTPIGGMDVFGTLNEFERRYVRTEPVTIWNEKTGKKRTSHKTVGYKNLDELKNLLTPMVLRRTEDQLTDINMPKVMPPNDIWLELHPEQRAKYQELQKGVLKLIAENGKEKITKVSALSSFAYGQQICSGLPALRITRKEKTYDADGNATEREILEGYEPDGAGRSVKLDWIENQLASEWATDKIVVFIKNIGLFEAFQRRLEKKRIGSALIRGGAEYSNNEYRDAQITKFWEDKDCRVLIGTSALERSLNLQVANKIVFVDQHLNPARMAQLVGRIKRAGSAHSHVFVYNLLTTDTQEERYMDILATRQALADFVWGESNELFDQLDPVALLELIGKPSK